jgi:protein gp37
MSSNIGSRSNIGWTDYSGGPFNFVLRGSRPGECECSPGCANCYALALRKRGGDGVAGVTTYSRDKLQKLLRLKLTEGCAPYRRGKGSRPLAFVCDMGDLFHPNVPDEFIREAFDVMRERKDVDWQILTKRPERMLGAARSWLATREWGMLPDNIWCGVTVEEQAHVARIEALARIPAWRFVSVEPMLGPVTLGEYALPLDWVICGGESGPKRRPFDTDWARALRDECERGHVAFFYKQGSSLHPGKEDVLDGRQWKEWPA